MSGMPWVKLYTELLDDPKVGRLSESAQLFFVKLILLAGECDAEGYLTNGEDPLDTEAICWRLRTDYEPTDAALTELRTAGFIEYSDDGYWIICKFAERQGRSQNEKRAQWAERKRRQRERESRGTEDVTEEDVTRESRGSHAGVTVTEGEGEREGEKKAAQASSSDDKTHKRVRSPPKDEIPTRQALFAVLVKATGWDAQLKRGRLNKSVKRLHDAGYSADDIDVALAWWYENDFRGKKGQAPTVEQLEECIKTALAGDKQRSGEYTIKVAT